MKTKRQRQMAALRVIDYFNGVSLAAKKCEVTQGAVSQWKTNGISELRLAWVMQKFPDIFKPGK